MTRLPRLQERRIDRLVEGTSLANEVYRVIQGSDAVRYAIGAMQPIDPEYTKNTFAQGDRVREQLRARLSEGCDYEYQGSTTNDTHIKARSDIDLLVLTTRWYWLDPSLPNEWPYEGDVKADMRRLRSESEESIRLAFPRAETDASKSTAISVEGGSLTRRVEVVPASWFDTPDYRRTNDKNYRGVKVFDKTSGVFSLNRPFLFNRRVEEKDVSTGGGMRKATRLMKSLMYDSSGSKMSSYNIASIAWNMPDSMLQHAYPFELELVESCRSYCRRLQHDAALRTSIRVPDDSRTVFDGEKGATIAELNGLTTELESLVHDIVTDGVRSFARLAEARVEYR